MRMEKFLNALTGTPAAISQSRRIESNSHRLFDCLLSADGQCGHVQPREGADCEAGSSTSIE